MEASFTRLDIDSENYHVTLLSPTHTSATPSFRPVTYFGTVGVVDVWVGIYGWTNAKSLACFKFSGHSWSIVAQGPTISKMTSSDRKHEWKQRSNYDFPFSKQ